MIEPLLSDEALVADIEAVHSGLHVWWLGQSGFLVTLGGTWRFLFDPYLSDSLTRKYAGTAKPHVRMSRRVIDPARLDDIMFVTSTHAHTDHLDPETLAALCDAGSPAQLIAPRAERELFSQRWKRWPDNATLMSDLESQVFGDVKIRAVVAAHDKIERDADGNSKYLGYVVEIGCHTIYHSGDTVYHPDIVEQVKRCPIDLAILPINGKVGNMNGTDAARLAKEIGAKLVVPCHYDLFEFNTADPKELFIPECERIGQAYRVLQLGERLTL